MASPGYDGSIKIDTRLDTKGFNQGIRAMTNSLKGFAAAVGVAFGVGAVLNFSRTAVNEAGNLAAAMVGLQSVVTGTGKSFSEAQAFITDFIADGLVPATNAITAYKNLAMRGYDTSQIEKTLIALKDAAAFGRQASLSIGQAVQSATEGLKNENSILVDNAGVTKNVSMMWKDYAESIGSTVGALTKQQKIQAEVAGILEETRFQTGDAAKLTAGYAGQVAALGTSFYNLRVAFGNVLIPILSKIIPVIKAAVDGLVILLNQFAQFVSVLFGVEMGIGNVVGETEAAAGAAGDLADNTKKAEKAAKGALAAFDELNVLQKPEEAGGEAGQVEIPGVTIPEVTPGDLVNPEIEAKVAAFKEKLLGLLQPAIDAFGRLREALAPLGQTIWEGLKWAWDNIIVPFGEWVLQDAVPVFLDLLAAGAEVLNEVLIALKPLALWLWEEFLQPLAEWTGQALLDALQWLTDRLRDISDWIRDNQETVRKIAVILGIFAAAWLIVTAAVAIWTTVVTIATGVTGAFAAVVAFLASPIGIAVLAIAALIAIVIFLVQNWDLVKETAGKVWDWIVDKWGQASRWFKEHVAEPVAKWFSKAWDDIKEWARGAWQWIVDTWNGAGEWFRVHVTEPVKGFFQGAWDGAKQLASSAWEGIKGIWTGIGTWFTTNVTEPVKDAFRAALDWVQEKWQTIFGGVGEIAKGAINTIIDFINSMLLAISEGINSVIGSLNSLQVTVPDWVPVFGGQTWGVNIPYVYAPQIPRLATGAVIPPNSQFLAVLGDQRSGRNIEAPEGLIRQIIQEELGRVEADIRIEFTGTLGALVRELKPRIDKENVRIGGSLIKKGAGA